MKKTLPPQGATPRVLDAVWNLLVCKRSRLISAGLISAILGAVPFSVMASSVVIDLWSTQQTVNAPANSTGQGTVTGSNILGGERDIFVESLGNATTTAEVTNDFLYRVSAGTEPWAAYVSWDGVDGNATQPTFDVNGDVDQANGLNLRGLDDGSGGIDFTTCGSGNVITMAFTHFSPNLDVTFEFFTSGTQWSTASKTIANPFNTTVVTFDLSSDFSAGGSNPANFTDIGAIRLITKTADGGPVDVPTPVFSCNLDFGDAPESHKTLLRDGGPRHVLGGPWLVDTSALQGSANDTDRDSDGQPGTGANGDDNTGTNDEKGVALGNLGVSDANGQSFQACDGIAMDPAQGRKNWYCAEVRVSNPSTSWAQVVAWVDFQGNGSFDNNCGSTSDGTVTFGASPCERSASAVFVGSGGLNNAIGTTCTSSAQAGDTIDDGTGFSGGNIPPGCEGNFIVTWNLDSVIDQLTLSQTYARFRVSTDSSFLSSQGPTPVGEADDGEVEDHVLAAKSLPVSISGFETIETGKGLEVRWSTVSETENIGFHLWNYTGDRIEPLTSDLIPSGTADAVHPQNYSYTIPSSKASRIGRLAITAVDNRGNEEMYGLFDIGQRYGRDDASTPIPWDSIRARTESRLLDLGFMQTAGAGWRDATPPQRPVAADFVVSRAGMQRITHDDLMAAGIDLRGKHMARIAVTVDGAPVARNIRTLERGDSIRGRSKWLQLMQRFSEDSVIEFWGEKPKFPNARYVENLIYRVELDSRKVVAAGEVPKAIMLGTTDTYAKALRDDRDNSYRMSSPLEDPWSLAELRSWVPAKASHTSVFELPENRIAGQAGEIEVVLAGGNDLAAWPDHHVQVQIAGVTIAEDFFDGRQVRRISAKVPAKLLARDSVAVEIRLPGGTESNVDMVLLESVELRVPTSTRAVDERLIVPHYEPGNYVLAEGFRMPGQAAWAWNGEQLLKVPTGDAGHGMIRAVPPAEEGFALWISSDNALHRPEPVAALGANSLLAEAGDFLVIAHPAFLPASASEPHPLNDFVAAREREGWNVRLIDITEVQAHYGGGMPLPQAVRRFLTAADSRFAYEHVLLVGGDSYDYRDILGMGSISFIPTFYAPTERIAHTPSDGLLADLDGDGVADKAIGRWPVRTLDDLESIVYKTLDWKGSMEGLRNAVWVADVEDPGAPSFQAQATRMIDQLVDAGWPQDQVNALFLDDMASADAGRDQLFSLLEQGRAFTGFVGHGAPSMWTFDGLLVPNDLAGLDNFGLPTMISTSTCYTSYFVSPYSETVAHRWMNGYDEDAWGNPIPGAQNGAVAIHGATTLSNYQQNEFVVSKVQAYQLQGMTLGQSVLQARRDAAARGLHDQVINWGLLGDPTLTVD